MNEWMNEWDSFTHFLCVCVFVVVVVVVVGGGRGGLISGNWSDSFLGGGGIAFFAN